MTNTELKEFTTKISELDDKELERIFFILKGMLMSREVTNKTKEGD